jgi:gas vesicle protein
MTTRTNLLLTAAASFACGMVAGVMFAPASGRACRRLLARKARHQAHWIDDQVHAIEERLGVLERQIHTASEQFGARVKEATERAIEQYGPGALREERKWDIESEEVARDLPRMPRS